MQTVKERDEIDMAHAVSQPNKVLISIVTDFDNLVCVLQQQIDSLSPADHEKRAHLTKAKMAAERGVELGQELVELTRSTKSAPAR